MRVAVFTGSAAGPATDQHAVAAFARELALSGAGIVYGGGKVGLMGVAADAALAAGGDVIGVMPRHLVDRGDRAHRTDPARRGGRHARAQGPDGQPR